MEYRRSWAHQYLLLEQRLQAMRKGRLNESSSQDCLLLLEHQPVYTLGRGADEAHLTFLNQKDNKDNDEILQQMRYKLSRKSRGPGTARLAMDRRLDWNQLFEQYQQDHDAMIDHLLQQVAASPVLVPTATGKSVPIYRVERGGEVTFHGPNQLVGYPLLNLQNEHYQRDLHWYLRQLEQVIILTLQAYDITGVRDDINTGVWVEQHKVAAVGVSASRWITTHGFALNVDPDLSYFDTSTILPCGIDGRGVTSMAQILRQRGAEESELPTILQVADTFLHKMMEVFQVDVEQGPTIS